MISKRLKWYLWDRICPCLAPTAEPISSKWENSRSQREKAQKAAQRHFDGLSEVTSALHRRTHHELQRWCRLKPDPNLQGGKFSSEGNRGLLILQLGHKHMCWCNALLSIIILSKVLEVRSIIIELSIHYEIFCLLNYCFLLNLVTYFSFRHVDITDH